MSRSGSGSGGSRRSGSKSSSRRSSSRRSGSGSGSRSYDGHGSVSADGNGYECEHDSECPPSFTCNGYGICEASGSGSHSGSRSGSRRSGSSSRRSGSKSSSRRSGSGSRSYDGHGGSSLLTAHSQGSNGNKPCTTNNDCDAPEVCNDEGHCFVAPENGGSLKAHAANLKPLLSAHGNGYECEHDSECPATFTCNSYGICEGGGSHDSMSRSGSGSGSRGSHRSGSSSRRSG